MVLLTTMTKQILIIAAVIVALITAAATLYITKQSKAPTTTEPVDISEEGIVVNNDADVPSSAMDLTLSSTPFSEDKVATISVRIGKREGYPTEGVNWPDTNAEIILPKGLELVEGDLTWQGDIIGDEIVEFKAKVRAIQNGEWKVEAYAQYIIDENNMWGDIERFYILVKDDQVLISEQRFTRPPETEEEEWVKPPESEEGGK